MFGSAFPVVPTYPMTSPFFSTLPWLNHRHNDRDARSNSIVCDGIELIHGQTAGFAGKQFRHDSCVHGHDRRATGSEDVGRLMPAIPSVASLANVSWMSEALIRR